MSRLPISSLLLLSPPEEMIPQFEAKPATKPILTNMEPPAKPTGPSQGMKRTASQESSSSSSPKVDATRDHPPSPPESPATALRQHKQFVKTQSRLSGVVDPPVVPQETNENAPPFPAAGALFPPIRDSIDVAIEKHIRDSAVHFVPSKSKNDRTHRYERPSMDEYRLAAAFVSTLQKQKSCHYVQIIRDSEHGYQPLRIAPRPRVNERIVLAPVQSKPGASVLAPKAPRVRKRSSTTKTTSPPTKKIATPRTKTVRDPPTPRSRTETPHTRHREPKKPIDENWRALPDYSPSSAALDENPNIFNQINWDGNPLDISADPDLGELHPAEIRLASALRLSVARYLTCKRRIFVARVETLKVNKGFKKTDAQQACQIDVNKASKLWIAYDKLNWFHPRHFTSHLDGTV